MSALYHQVRRGAYADSIVLMQLESALAALPGVEEAGVVMATDANLDLLRANRMLPRPEPEAGPEDLLLVVRSKSENDAGKALAQVDELLARRSGSGAGGYRPKSLEAAIDQLPEAEWVLLSVPGRYAATVARQALDRGRNVFLYSDNVDWDDELELKTRALDQGLLVMGPDCGTALIDGVGFGFANRVRRGSIGLVAASGTGLQAISTRIHRLGGGVSQAIGTGGRDLSRRVGGATTRQALGILAADGETRVIVVVSKPPEPRVASEILALALELDKPVVIAFQGLSEPLERVGNVRFARGLGEAADLATALSGGVEASERPSSIDGDLRALFAGGTLAFECVSSLAPFLHPLSSNLAFPGVGKPADIAQSRGHTVLDLGADELTVGRLHPMIDPELRVGRLRQEAADPDTGLILIDVVLGDGAESSPAESLVGPIEDARRLGVEIFAVVVGTEDDPQDLEECVSRLEEAGATVFVELEQALGAALERLSRAPEASAVGPIPSWRSPIAAINVGLEHFCDSLAAQGVETLQVDWRPPAGGDERLMAILERMKAAAAPESKP